MAPITGCDQVGGEVVVTGTVLGDAVFEPDGCSAAVWGDMTRVLITDSTRPDWELGIHRTGDDVDVDLLLFGRRMVVGDCDYFDVSMRTDWDEVDVRGHVRLGCDLVAGGTIEGDVVFNGCR
jgi:hypothetical protein